MQHHQQVFDHFLSVFRSKSKGFHPPAGPGLVTISWCLGIVKLLIDGYLSISRGRERWPRPARPHVRVGGAAKLVFIGWIGP